MSDPRTPALAQECGRESESCKYTAVQLYIWLRSQRRIERALIMVPIVLGAVAACSVINDDTVPYARWITGFCALLAGLLPAIYKALKLDVHVGKVAEAAGEYTALRDLFRQLQSLGPLGQYADFKAEFDNLMHRLDTVRKLGFVPPERFFKKAQKKIKDGDYDYDADVK